METLMSLAMLVYATVLAFLAALWIAWLSLRGLFRVFPARRLTAAPIQAAAPRGTGTIGRHAA